ncbi:uncharacterized protein LOC122624329 [Drosophila teissieri]|uniref:uncharacterized protein LOC122624329 n=1 Tax=Drosophila teissieri TaxID=7243 RepID=UPI001CBA57A4|nr:uncharacterized protein LOC122624329 [Drosophila teissieri]
MANRLTEQLVEAKAKVSDYRKAVRLNAWGGDLVDISICLRMPLLEVLALSLNKINTLSGLVNCTRLKELYLRKNDIPSFDELNYLANAKNLTSLWLESNPCSDAAGDDYRACVLRKLPNLKKLDNVDVDDLELQAALRHEYYPQLKSAIVSPVTEPFLKPGCSPKVQACFSQMEKERERERNRDRVRREQERRREPQQREPPQGQSCQNYDELQLPRPNRFAGGDARDIEETVRVKSPTPKEKRNITGDHMRRRMPSAAHHMQQDQRVQEAQPAQQDQHVQEEEQPAQQTQKAQQVHHVNQFHQLQQLQQVLQFRQNDRAQQTMHTEQIQHLHQNPPSPRLTDAAAAAMLIAQNRLEMINSRRYDSRCLLPNDSSQAPISNAYYTANYGSVERRRYQHGNLLSATLCLIREMDTCQLEVLIHAIHEQVSNHPMNY